MLNNGMVELNGRGKKRSYEYEQHANVKIKKTKYHEETAGVIKKIHLENFMSHSSFTWEPTANMNFITGVNGSGKSSILQALVLGLNGEVKNIKRYSQAKEFVKKDCDKATIEITFVNAGEDAYKPERFGEEITVQRVINESGTTRYSLKDASMKDVAKFKEAKLELKRILDKFQIQIDSPIVILHQDVAKELLKIESPNKLYTFFERATLIKHCQDELFEATKEYNKAKANLAEKHKSLRALNKEFKETKILYEQAEEKRKLNDELQKVKGEYAWANVHEWKEKADKKIEEIATLENRISKPMEKLLTLHDDNQALKKEQAELEVKMEEERARCHKQEEEVNRLKRDYDILKENQKGIVKSLKENTSKKNACVTEMRAINTQMMKLEKSGNNEAKRKRERERKSMLETLNADLVKAEQKVKNEGFNRDAQEKQILEEVYKEKTIKKQLSQLDDKINCLKVELDEIESSSNFGAKHLAVFGAKIPALDKEIKKNNHRFQRVPIGPIGAHVNLTGEAGRNHDLARLIETELSRALLLSYITHTDQDRRLLMSLMDRVYGPDSRMKPKIYTSKFLDKRHRVSKPSCNTPILEDYINIDDDNVYNHLVDQKSIEKILVCSTQEEAKRLMSFKQNVPANVSYTITHDFNRFLPARANSNYRSYYIDIPTGSGLLRSTMTSHIQEKRREIQELNEERLNLDSSLRKIEMSKKSFEAEKARANQAQQSLRTEIKKLRSQITKFMSQVENEDAEIDNLSIRLQIKEDELKSISSNMEDIMERKNKLDAEISQKNEELKRSRENLNSVREDSEHSAAHKQLETRMKSMSKTIKNQETLILKIRKNIDDYKKEEKAMRNKEADYRKAAVKLIPDEFVPSKSSKELNGKLHSMKKKLSVKNSNTEQDEDILANFCSLKERYSLLKSQVEMYSSHLKTIQQMKEERENLIILIRTCITNMIRRKFNAMIQEFASKLNSQIFLRINHQRKSLQFVFKSADGKSERTNVDVSSLSGGEKSYTQMCLICALWELMEPPFRCLDEWDVFLDAVNRKQISRELLKFGERHSNKQFIFISPQGACDLSDVPHGLVNIINIEKNQ